MSSSEANRGHLDLSTDQPGTRFTVRDTFRAIAEGVNRLTVDLAPGLYQLDTRVGDAVQSEVLAVYPGDRHVRRVEAIPSPTIAPVANSSNTREDFTRAAEQASAAVPPDAAGALVVVVCRPPDDDAPHFPHGDTELLDGDLRPVDEWHDGWSHTGRAVSWTRPLDPGGYVLRMETGEDGDRQRIDRPLWIEQGWQTIVFCIRHHTHVELSLVSTHMCRIDRPWRSEDPVNAALETALAGYRHGRRLVSAEQVFDWLAASANPMLGIIAAYALRTGRHPDHRNYDRIVARLRDLVPSHPDVVALSMQTDGRLQPAGRQLAWPPLVASGYCDLAVPASLDDEDAIEEGSLAERIAGDIVVHGVWLAWMSLPPAADEGRPPGGDVLAEGGGVRVMTLGFSVPASDGPILEGLDDVDVSGPADRPAPEIRAVDRVEGFVHQVSAVRGVSTAEVLRDWDARDIARSTTLPLRTARQAIEALAARSVEAAASTTGDASEKAPTKSDIRESRTS